jgi:cephalosporin-C deacetylase
VSPEVGCVPRSPVLIKTIGLLAALAVCLAFTPQVRAQQDGAGNNYELKGVTDRSDAIYHVNELVGFEFTLSNNGKPVSAGEVTYVISKDGQSLSDGRKVISNGRIILSGQMSEPGFLRCRVTYVLKDGSELMAMAAAAIDPSQIKSGTPAPDDFDIFWDAQKQKCTRSTGWDEDFSRVTARFCFCNWNFWLA